jgi:hypothetical protein
MAAMTRARLNRYFLAHMTLSFRHHRLAFMLVGMAMWRERRSVMTATSMPVMVVINCASVKQVLSVWVGQAVIRQRTLFQQRFADPFVVTVFRFMKRSVTTATRSRETVAMLLAMSSLGTIARKEKGVRICPLA